MAQTPAHIEELLEQLRAILVRWDDEDILGEVVCVRGYHQYEVEERPRRKHRAVRREEAGRKPIRTVK